MNDQHHRSKNFDGLSKVKMSSPANSWSQQMSFQFKRLQFPIQLAFAITINKAERQSLELCSLYLHTDCFSHMLPVPDNLFIYTENGTTKNIGSPQVLNNTYLDLLNFQNKSQFFFFEVIIKSVPDKI